MPRNLNDRVELFFPIEGQEHIERIKGILKLCLKDNVGAHLMQSNGTYRRVAKHGASVSVRKLFTPKRKLPPKRKKCPWNKDLNLCITKGLNFCDIILQVITLEVYKDGVDSFWGL